jgi:hypothetical protein
LIPIGSILSGVCAGTAYFLISVLLPKALVDQGAAVSVGFGVTSLVYFASMPGKAFTGFLMEIIGRRWTITGKSILTEGAGPTCGQHSFAWMHWRPRCDVPDASSPRRFPWHDAGLCDEA